MANNKLKLFHAVQKYFNAMGFFASPLQPNERCKFNWINLYFVLVLVIPVVPVLGFLIFKAQSAYEYGITFYAAITVILRISNHLTIINDLGKMLKLNKKYEEIIKNRIGHESTSASTYAELKSSIERTSKLFYFILVKLALIGSILPLSLLSMVNYFILDLGDESFILPVPMLLPFDWKTPFGYLIAFSGEIATVHTTLFGFTPILSFFVGSAWLAICLINDIAKELPQLNAIATSTQSRRGLKKRLCYVVHFYSDAKQLIDELSQVYEFTIFALFLWSILSISSVLLIFVSQLTQDSNPVEMIFTLMLMFISFLSIFFFCEFGEMVNTQFEKFDVELYQCYWYTFPIDMQQMLMTFMTYTQRSTMIHGFSNTECTRTTFKRTINGGFSYFMTLRNISA